MSGQIFISYRREESRWSARSLNDRLCRDFEPKQIFMDLDAIALGEDFVEAIEMTVAKCDVLIAVIGNNWLTSKDERGGRRLDNPEDFVRMEIGTALKRKIRVIPVLVDGASMPQSTELPEDLKPLVRRNALPITDTSFDGDCRRLAVAIQQALEKTAAERTALKEGEQKPTLGQIAKLRELEPILQAKQKSEIPPVVSIISGSPPQNHFIQAGNMVIGRAVENDLVLGDPEISRRHCRIVEEGGKWWIEDLGSRRGTMVNGTRVDGHAQIYQGDKIRVGSVTLVFGELRVIVEENELITSSRGEEQERLGAEQRQREEAEARERAEKERLEAEQREKERLEAENHQRAEQEMLEAAQQEQERRTDKTGRNWWLQLVTKFAFIPFLLVLLSFLLPFEPGVTGWLIPDMTGWQVVTWQVTHLEVTAIPLLTAFVCPIIVLCLPLLNLGHKLTAVLGVIIAWIGLLGLAWFVFWLASYRANPGLGLIFAIFFQTLGALSKSLAWQVSRKR